MCKRRAIYILILSAMLLVLPIFNYVYAKEERVTIELRYKDIKATYYDKKIKPSNYLVIEDMFYRGINEGWKEKNGIINNVLSRGASPKKAVLYAYPLLEERVEEFCHQINSQPQSSEITFNPLTKPYFKISRDKMGYRVDEEKLYYDILLSLHKSSHPIIEVIVKEIKPKVSTKDNIALTHKISSFSTDYSHSSDERKHNIQRALSQINGIKLLPNEKFSFNERVGKRTIANGYKESKIILDGKYVNGIGGGVCQASTTLYNGALLADMEIVMANHHSLPCSYVPPSFDAMVNSGSSDLIFINKHKTPVFIRTFCDKAQASVEFYGAPLPYRIERKSRIINKILPPPDKVIIDRKLEYFDKEGKSGDRKYIQYPHTGIESEGYLYYYKQDKLSHVKCIRSDTYYSSQGIVALYP